MKPINTNKVFKHYEIQCTVSLEVCPCTKDNLALLTRLLTIVAPSQYIGWGCAVSKPGMITLCAVAIALCVFKFKFKLKFDAQFMTCTITYMGEIGTLVLYRYKLA